jgi:hypothetical protein
MQFIVSKEYTAPLIITGIIPYYDPDLVYFWEFADGTIKDKIHGKDLVFNSGLGAYAGEPPIFEPHPINTGTQALMNRNTRHGLPNGIDPLMPTSMFSIRIKMYYVRPTTGVVPAMDMAIYLDYYYGHIGSAPTTTLNSLSWINIGFSHNLQKLSTRIDLNGQKGLFSAFPNDITDTPHKGLNTTGFKNIVITVEQTVMKLYVNGIVAVQNLKHQLATGGLEFGPGLRPGLNNTTSSPFRTLLSDATLGQMYVESYEIFDRILTGDELL